MKESEKLSVQVSRVECSQRKIFSIGGGICVGGCTMKHLRCMTETS